MKTQDQNSNYYILNRYIHIGLLFVITSTNYFKNALGYIIIKSLSILSPILKTNIKSVNLIHNNITLTISNACIGVEAYMLLALLIFSTPMKSLSRNLIAFLESALIISIINIIRIFLLLLLITKYPLEVFDKIHMILYNAINGIIIAITVIYVFRKRKVTSKPLLSDIQYLCKKILNKNTQKK